MLKLRKVAVTGTVASGKSSVCRILEKYGAYVVSADNIVHEFLKSDKNLNRKVIQLLGSDVVVGKNIDRAEIAKKVFSNEELLQKLEMVIHPEVKKELERLYKAAVARGEHRFFVAEIPLLFECGWEESYDATIAVLANKEICKQRFLSQNKGGEDQFDRRNRRMLSPEEKARRADFVIINEGSLENLEQQVKSTITLLEASNGKRDRK